jgi:carbonyl reductase 1
MVAIRVPPAARWYPRDAVAVVTGGARGIGLEVSRALAANGMRVVAAGRDEKRGTAAVATLAKETGGQVEFARVDLADPATISSFADTLRARGHASRIAVLVNNASIAYKGTVWGAAEAEATMDVNFRGTRALTDALLPLLASPARIVTVASMAGKRRLLAQAPELLARWDAAASADDVDALASEFVAAVASGDWRAKGWPPSMYGVSKLAEATYTRLLNEELKNAGKEVTAVACCPGSVATDMSSFRGRKTPAEGADTPAWLALEAGGREVAGRFFSGREEEPW